MRAFYRIALAAFIGLALTVGMASHGIAQQQTNSVEQQLVGTWFLVSDVATRPDGTPFEPFGDNPKGILMFDRMGHFSIQYSGDARRKVASNDRLRGTPEEDKANAKGRRLITAHIPWTRRAAPSLFMWSAARFPTGITRI